LDPHDAFLRMRAGRFRTIRVVLGPPLLAPQQPPRRLPGLRRARRMHPGGACETAQHRLIEPGEFVRADPAVPGITRQSEGLLLTAPVGLLGMREGTGLPLRLALRLAPRLSLRPALFPALCPALSPAVRSVPRMRILLHTPTVSAAPPRRRRVGADLSVVAGRLR